MGKKFIQIREIEANCNCRYSRVLGCSTYEEMQDKYCDIPKGEMVLEVNAHLAYEKPFFFVCKEHASYVLTKLKKEIDEALEEAERLDWNLTEDEGNGQ